MVITYKKKTSHCNIFICVLLNLLIQQSNACGAGYGIHRKFNNKFKVMDKQPDINENSLEASGFEGPALLMNDSRLDAVKSTSIVFTNSKHGSPNRLAIKTCRVALLKLAELVDSYWHKKYKIMVINGYLKRMPTHEHLRSFHVEGRAFDLKLTSYRKDEPITVDDDQKVRNLRLFAGLAYYKAGFSFVQLHKSHKYIHVSCKKTNEGTDGIKRKRCFPGDSYVRTENGDKKLMKNIRPGDKVLTMKDGKMMHSEISMIMHRQDDVVVNDYVTIHTHDARHIVLSPYHLIFTLENGAIFSKDVKVNETLHTYQSESRNFSTSRVVYIEYSTVKYGAYAPLSMDGTIIVNDVYASCYALFPSHSISHAVFSVWRILYKYVSPFTTLFDSDQRSEFHWYPDVLRNVVNKLYILPYQM